MYKNSRRSVNWMNKYRELFISQLICMSLALHKEILFFRDMENKMYKMQITISTLLLSLFNGGTKPSTEYIIIIYNFIEIFEYLILPLNIHLSLYIYKRSFINY